jgi:environmental stress-induced protein Ves
LVTGTDKKVVPVTNYRVINKTRFRKMPWANGGGVTTELIAHSDEQSDRILWRLSMAGVTSDGPFSHFAGYDRILVLMQGRGLTLSHGDGAEQVLSTVYDMASFPGDAQTRATLAEGPIQDFNVIADRSTFAASVIVTRAGTECRVPIHASVLAVFAVDDDLLIVGPDEAGHPVPKGDLLLVEAPQQGDWRVCGATAIIVQLVKIMGDRH